VLIVAPLLAGAVKLTVSPPKLFDAAETPVGAPGAARGMAVLVAEEPLVPAGFAAVTLQL
jgi:hypothetical protein